MHKAPWIITLGLTLVVSVAGTILASRELFVLTDAELVQAEIALFGLLGAFIAAGFLVFEYRQSISAFTESQRPHLLFQLFNRFQEVHGELESDPVTEIQYRNITPNTFVQLSFSLIVVTPDGKLDISDLLPESMTLTGFDQRVKWFQPVKLINERGLFLNIAGDGRAPPMLQIAYEHNFLGRRERVELHSYTWDVLTQIWEPS